MRTIDILPDANQAPMVPETDRRRMLGYAIIAAGCVPSVIALGILVGSVFGRVTNDALPFALAANTIGMIVTFAGIGVLHYANRG